MKSNSKLFDSIRVKPRRADKTEAKTPLCAWKGCNKPGLHKAPKKGAPGEYHYFCLEHARAYNQNFNFFEEGSEDKLGDMLRRAAATGERPTWKTSSNAKGRSNPKPYAHRPRDFSGRQFADPLNLFARVARNQGKASNPIKDRERRILEADRRAMETLGLEGYPETHDIKRAYKALVKKHHPDANGGDRASEDRLRAIISAYTHLKQKGFV